VRPEARTSVLGVVRIAEDVDGADLSGVAGTPTFFVNGRRYQGSFDIDDLSEAVRVARLLAVPAP
jgi:protein-disulfide isomerase